MLVAGDRVGRLSQWLLRGKLWKPWLLKGIRGGRRGVEQDEIGVGFVAKSQRDSGRSGLSRF